MSTKPELGQRKFKPKGESQKAEDKDSKTNSGKNQSKRPWKGSFQGGDSADPPKSQAAGPPAKKSKDQKWAGKSEGKTDKGKGGWTGSKQPDVCFVCQKLGHYTRD